MSRIVAVKYLTPVFVDVDLDEKRVVRVQHGDSEVHRVDDDLPKWLESIGVDDVIGPSYLYDAEAVDTTDPDVRTLAIDIAEGAEGDGEWPAWEGY